MYALYTQHINNWAKLYVFVYIYYNVPVFNFNILFSVLHTYILIARVYERVVNYTVRIDLI